MKKVLIVVVVIVVVFGAVQYARRDYLAFDAQREDWHRRCDAYVGIREPVASNSAAAADCKQDLDEMTAYAARKGWTAAQ